MGVGLLYDSSKTTGDDVNLPAGTYGREMEAL
jgi:hypothetical protein